MVLVLGKLAGDINVAPQISRTFAPVMTELKPLSLRRWHLWRSPRAVLMALSGIGNTPLLIEGTSRPK